MMKCFQFLFSLKLRCLLLIICGYLSNLYGATGKDIPYHTLYLVMVMEVNEEHEKTQAIAYQQKLISIKRIVNNKQKHLVVNAYNSHPTTEPANKIRSQHNHDISQDLNTVEKKMKYLEELKSEYADYFKWEYDGMIWDLTSLKEALAYLASKKNRKHASVNIYKGALKITKQLLLSTVANIQSDQHAYYFEIAYQKNNQSKIMRLLCVRKGDEYGNSYFMPFTQHGQPLKESKSNDNFNRLPFEKYENEEINLMRLLATIGKDNKAKLNSSEAGFDKSRKTTSLLNLPILFQFNTYTTRKNEEDVTNDLLYTLHFDEKAQITCRAYRHNHTLGTIKEDKKWNPSVLPVLPLADYSIFVIKNQTFYEIDSFKTTYRKHWVNDLLSTDKMKEMIAYHNASVSTNQYNEEDIELARTLGNEPYINMPRFGFTSIKKVDIKKGIFGISKFKHKIYNLIRGTNENLKIHYFIFSTHYETIMTIAVPTSVLEGKNKLLFQKKDSSSGEWVPSPNPINQQYALMLIDSLLQNKENNRNKIYTYQLNHGDRTPIKVNIDKNKNMITYQQFWKNIGWTTEPIQLILGSQQRNQTDNEQPSKDHYVITTTGLIALLINIIYGTKRYAKKHKNKS